MPRPRSGEDESAYVSRFMESAEALKDYPDEKQRAAVAYSMFRERANNNELCRACGAATPMNAEGLINDCLYCGDRAMGQQTKPIEDLDNLCRACRHVISPEHDDFGCHVPDCSCTMTGAAAIDQIKSVLPNKAENENAETSKFCRECQSRLGGKSPEGLDGFVQDGVMHVGGNTKDKALCGVMVKENANAKKMECPSCHGKNTKLIHDSEGGRFATADGWECQDCDRVWTTNAKTGAVENKNAQTIDVTFTNLDTGEERVARGYHNVSDAADVIAQRVGLSKKDFDAKWRIKAWELHNATPDAQSAVAAFVEHQRECAQCKDAGDASGLCAEGSQLLVMDLKNEGGVAQAALGFQQPTSTTAARPKKDHENAMTQSQAEHAFRQHVKSCSVCKPEYDKMVRDDKSAPDANKLCAEARRLLVADLENAGDAKADAQQIERLAEGIKHEAKEIQMENYNAADAEVYKELQAVKAELKLLEDRFGGISQAPAPERKRWDLLETTKAGLEEALKNSEHQNAQPTTMAEREAIGAGRYGSASK